MIPLIQTDPALAAAWLIIQAGSAVALPAVVVVVGGMLLAMTVIRCTLTVGRRSWGPAPGACVHLLALVLYHGCVFSVWTGRVHIPGVIRMIQPGDFPAGNRLMLQASCWLLLWEPIARKFAVWKVVSNTNIEQETFRLAGRSLSVKVYAFAFVPALITTLSMLIMLAATLAWAWLALSTFPQESAGNLRPWGPSMLAWFIGIITLMSLSTLVGFFGLGRGRPAHKALSAERTIRSSYFPGVKKKR